MKNSNLAKLSKRRSFRSYQPYLSSIISPEPLDEAAERRGKSVYYGLCSEVDAQLGRLFERLKEIGEWDKTLVVFTADHVRHPTHFVAD